GLGSAPPGGGRGALVPAQPRLLRPHDLSAGLGAGREPLGAAPADLFRRGERLLISFPKAPPPDNGRRCCAVEAWPCSGSRSCCPDARRRLRRRSARETQRGN